MYEEPALVLISIALIDIYDVYYIHCQNLWEDQRTKPSSHPCHLATRLLPLVQITLPSNPRRHVWWRIASHSVRIYVHRSSNYWTLFSNSLLHVDFFIWWFVSTPMLTFWNVYWIIGATSWFEPPKKDRHEARLHGLDPKEVLLPIEATTKRHTEHWFLKFACNFHDVATSMSMFPFSLILYSLHFQWFLLFVELSRLVLVRNCSEPKTLSQQSKSSPRHLFQMFFPAIRDEEIWKRKLKTAPEAAGDSLATICFGTVQCDEGLTIAGLLPICLRGEWY